MHCVTSWSKLDTSDGIQARHLRRCRSRSRGPVSLPCSATAAIRRTPRSMSSTKDVLFVTHHNGEPLEPGHGYPMRLVIPRLVAWKSAKWIRA